MPETFFGCQLEVGPYETRNHKACEAFGAANQAHRTRRAGSRTRCIFPFPRLWLRKILLCVQGRTFAS
ncbi:hypothetical protein VTK73DRAFT_259 [Phialemonium thermophilum]|uniref:Uncharacterized protein n=1 Tax=Phialemonium thermophilum TaxID=223376 RepID=A0ABR3XFK6_9PEZI